MFLSREPSIPMNTMWLKTLQTAGWRKGKLFANFPASLHYPAHWLNQPKFERNWEPHGQKEFNS